MKKIFTLLLIASYSLLSSAQFSVGNNQTICLGDTAQVIATLSGPGTSGCNGIIDQKNCTLYSGTAHKENHVWGYVVKADSENHKRGDILTKNYKVVGNVLDGNTANLGMPNSHYPNYTVCWSHNDIWKRN